jgi:hypothetical protein
MPDAPPPRPTSTWRADSARRVGDDGAARRVRPCSSRAERRRRQLVAEDGPLRHGRITLID